MAACLLLSAYFSATETAFSSANSTRLKTLAEKGNKNAALACRLLGQYDKLLSTILIGNNIVNILMASIGTVLFVRCYGDAGATISTVVVTVVVLIFGEISPKSIAKEADFFSFGTNDLTQMTFGFSRDDAGKFLGAYYDKKIYENDPFAKLDQVGVGKLVKMAATMGRESNPDIHLGICGEHGGDPASVEFCHKVGLDYVSCSPFRVPIARLAAAQAAIKEM